MAPAAPSGPGWRITLPYSSINSATCRAIAWRWLRSSASASPTAARIEVASSRMFVHRPLQEERRQRLLLVGILGAVGGVLGIGAVAIGAIAGLAIAGGRPVPAAPGPRPTAAPPAVAPAARRRPRPPAGFRWRAPRSASRCRPAPPLVSASMRSLNAERSRIEVSSSEYSPSILARPNSRSIAARPGSSAKPRPSLIQNAIKASVEPIGCASDPMIASGTRNTSAICWSLNFMRLGELCVSRTDGDRLELEARGQDRRAAGRQALGLFVPAAAQFGHLRSASAPGRSAARLTALTGCHRTRSPGSSWRCWRRPPGRPRVSGLSPRRLFCGMVCSFT